MHGILYSCIRRLLVVPDGADLEAVVAVGRACAQQHVVLDDQRSGHGWRISCGESHSAAYRAVDFLIWSQKRLFRPILLYRVQ